MMSLPFPAPSQTSLLLHGRGQRRKQVIAAGGAVLRVVASSRSLARPRPAVGLLRGHSAPHQSLPARFYRVRLLHLCCCFFVSVSSAEFPRLLNPQLVLLSPAELRRFMPDEKLDVVEDYEYELSDIEIQQLKEHNQRRVKRVVALVAVLMTLLALGLVTMSLALGNRIDMMVEQDLEKRAADEFLRTGINITQNR
ncbi:hypothetical protein OSTOST_14480 [Ostertagia ostertagi]